MEKTTPTVEANYVGLDVSKDQLDHSVDGIRCDHVPNTRQGHDRLLAEWRSLRGARVVCEATGGYESAIVAALLVAGIEVCVVNPGRVRAFAPAEGLLAKTDVLDARLLRRFGQKAQPCLHAPMEAEAVALRELFEYRRQVSDQLVAVRHRLELAGPLLRQRLEGQVAFLEKEMAETNQLIEEHIDHDDTLRRKAARLRELNGTGPVLAATLLAYLPELGTVESPQLSALVGVAPFAKDSGHSHRPRQIRGGRGVIRNGLDMAAVCAAQPNRILSELYTRLIAKGKPKKITAARHATSSVNGKMTNRSQKSVHAAREVKPRASSARVISLIPGTSSGCSASKRCAGPVSPRCSSRCRAMKKVESKITSPPTATSPVPAAADSPPTRALPLRSRIRGRAATPARRHRSYAPSRR